MTDERIIAYLLEELPEEEMEQFEDECFALESRPSQLSLAEEDLIDAYLRKELMQERHQRFERNYLTTEARRERVILAAALLHRVDEDHVASKSLESKATTSPTWAERFRAFWSDQPLALRVAAAFALVAIIAGVLWLPRSRQPSQTFATLTLALSVNNNRAEGFEAGKVKLPLNADALRISLTLPEQLHRAAGYRIELENDKGESRPLEISGPENQSLTVIIPAAQLARGQYALKLYVAKAGGTEQRVNGSYFFTVE